jgi:NifU-like protein involved in Fe-S cluster formation
MNFLGACGVLIAIVVVWFLVHYWLTPHLDEPDGKASLTGSCGDTMEISLKFRGDKVVDASPWTNGCANSLNCVSTAADLALGKTPDEIVEIDDELIAESSGGLPRDHMHCAALAAETLHSALEDYMQKCASCSCSAQSCMDGTQIGHTIKREKT